MWQKRCPDWFFIATCLARGVPDVELELATVGGEGHGVHFDALGSHILLLELAGQVALHEGGLARAAVADKHALELRDCSSHYFYGVERVDG